MEDLVTSMERRQRYEAAGWWDQVTLVDRVVERAAADPAGLAVVDRDGTRRRSVGQLEADSAGLAAHLCDHGVGVGDVVSVQLPNVYEAVVAAVAILRSGAVINPLLPNYRAKELGHIVSTAAPKAIITPDRYRDFDHRELVRTVRSETGRDLHHVVVGLDDGDGADSRYSAEAIGFDVAAATGPGRDRAGAPASAVSELIFTSGTEATPKAIMHTEQTANFSVRVAYDDLALDEQAVVWMPSPIGHSTGFNYGVRFALFHGRPLVLQDRWDVDVALDLIEHERCSYTLAATTFLQDLVAASVATGRTLPTLTHFGCGGAPVPRELVRAALDRGIRVLRLYGSTEVLVGSWNRPSSTFDQRAGTDGVAMSHVEFEIRDLDGGRCRSGQPGEAFVRGPNTCVGFFDDPARTAATFDDEGWVASGDLLVQDDDGHLSVVGRRKEIIIRGGLNIAPREIEDLLLGFPEVERAAVVGLPDERLGERMCACVVLRDGTDLDLADAVERLRGLGLATYKLPERLEVVEALPSTPSGKIQKHLLVAELTR